MAERSNGEQDILMNIQQIILTANRCFENGDVDCTIILTDLRQSQRSLNLVSTIGEYSKRQIEATIAALIDQIEIKIANHRQENAFFAPRENVSGGSGRYKVIIPNEQLQTLYDLNFTAPQMAEKFGCSIPLIYKRLQEAGLKLRDRYSNISDADLDSKVSGLQSKFPNAGSVMMNGLLQSSGENVQRERVRESINRTSPFPVVQRLTKTVKRRRYSVPMSNSYWHIDGHMKLIRWGISTHGGIDGFSRLIVFLKADTDNRASTVLQHFIKACLQYGVPSRVRSDHGGENIMVALFMNLINGDQRHSHVTGRSVHNIRIERLWRDVFIQVCQKYHNLFYGMEDEGLLDVENVYHIFALHKVYLPVINEELEIFRQGYNKHRLSTENGRSPEQLWTSGILSHINSDATPVQNLYGRPLEETLEVQLRYYGLNPEDFSSSEDTSPSLLSEEQSRLLDLRLYEDLTPEQAYKKCLDYLTEIGLL